MNCRVKICGITNLDDALMASSYGADALGFVFYKKSPRYISPIEANEIVAQLPPFITPVALFVDEQESIIDSVLKGSPRWIIQFHGNETEYDCIKYNRPYLKALRVRQDVDIKKSMDDYPNATAILLDAYKKGVPGGTGEAFDWSLIPSTVDKPIILAGGLTPKNIEQAVLQVNPYAVDVSGGVERSKGLKSESKIKEFMSGVKSE